MALKVIGAGLGRTGTLSLKLALEHLGFGPCYHMAEVFANLPTALPKWMDVIAGRPDWDAVFAGYAATVDYPGCTYWRELAAHYPEAKVILSVRDAEGWFESVNETIFSPGHAAMFAGTPLEPFMASAVRGMFGDRIADRDFMVDFFNRWRHDVVATLPPERLLVFSARNGWEPLCAFLGVPVPDAPYPRVNSREEQRALAEAAERPEPSAEMLPVMARAFLDQCKANAFGPSAATA